MKIMGNYNIGKLVVAISVFLLGITNSYSQTIYTVETIPNPKLNNGFVSNPDSIIAVDYVDSLNSLIQKIEDSTTIQIAVVAVNSIGDIDSYKFRTELFNYWGVGQAGKNNGLLVLMVMDKKRIEIAVGLGLEEVFTEELCLKIIMQTMVPLAKVGDFSKCIYEGVKKIETFIQ